MASAVGLYPVRCWDCNRTFDPRFREYLRLVQEETDRRHAVPPSKEPPRSNQELLDRAGLYGCCRKLALGQADEPVGDVLHMREDIKTNWVPPRATGRLIVASEVKEETKTETKTTEAKKPRVYNVSTTGAATRAMKEYQAAIKAGKPAVMPPYEGLSISQRITRGQPREEVEVPEFDLVEDFDFGGEEALEEDLAEMSLR